MEYGGNLLAADEERLEQCVAHPVLDGAFPFDKVSPPNWGFANFKATKRFEAKSTVKSQPSSESAFEKEIAMKNGAVILGILLTLAIGQSAEAKQYASKKNGKEVVVHDRLGPVVMHRVFPPYLGKHVYDRSGK